MRVLARHKYRKNAPLPHHCASVHATSLPRRSILTAIQKKRLGHWVGLALGTSMSTQTSSSSADSVDEAQDSWLHELTQFPGFDLLMKALFDHPEVKDIAVRAAIGDGIAHGAMYETNRNNVLKSGPALTSYFGSARAHIRTLPPIIIEIQHHINDTFMLRTIGYCVKIAQRTSHYRY
ncbi:hypothetical protein BC940DRAFT_332849 [Gongronella butleri]|nr:hypothetical protein BC940DRAFT_332849 [Gongronella butleri]